MEMDTVMRQHKVYERERAKVKKCKLEEKDFLLSLESYVESLCLDFVLIIWVMVFLFLLSFASLCLHVHTFLI